MENLGIFPLSSDPGCPPHFGTPGDGGVESLQGVLLQESAVGKTGEKGLSSAKNQGNLPSM